MLELSYPCPELSMSCKIEVYMLPCTAAGVVTGAGRQATGAVINFCTYWGVGLALAATLAFKAGLGVHGLWLGVMAGSATQVPSVIFTSMRGVCASICVLVLQELFCKSTP